MFLGVGQPRATELAPTWNNALLVEVQPLTPRKFVVGSFIGGPEERPSGKKQC